MNTVTNHTREQDLSMASNLVRGIKPRVPTFLVQRYDDEAFEGCRGSERMCFSVSTSTPATCTSSQRN